MITELLGLAGSGILGSLFGVVSDMMHGRRENKRLELELRLQQEARLHGQNLEYLRSNTGFSTGRPYAFAFLLLCATYCTAALVCFLFPSVPILTFDPDAEPRTVRILWGLVSWTVERKTVYTITTGGVGLALLHPLAFQIGTVITGVNPVARK